MIFEQWPTSLVASPYDVGMSIHYPASSVGNDFNWTECYPLKAKNKKEKCDEIRLYGTKCRNHKICKRMFFFILCSVRIILANFASVNF